MTTATVTTAYDRVLSTPMLERLYEATLETYRSDLLGLRGTYEAWEKALDHVLKERIHGDVSAMALSSEMVATGLGIVIPGDEDGADNSVIPTIPEAASNPDHKPLSLITLMRQVAKVHLRDRVEEALAAEIAINEEREADFQIKGG